MMYYNTMAITLSNEKFAAIALEILRNRLSAGFECDRSYDNSPAARMSEELMVNDNTVMIPRNSEYYQPEDFLTIVPTLLKDLAENIGRRRFSCKGHCKSSEYQYGYMDAEYQRGTLVIKSVYHPMGFCEEYCCEDCGEIVIDKEDYETGKTYICPHCGKVVDPSNQVSIFREVTFVVFLFTFLYTFGLSLWPLF